VNTKCRRAGLRRNEIASSHTAACREQKIEINRGNRTYRGHQGTSQIQGPPVGFRSLQATCGRMNRLLQAATSDVWRLPWMHT
jgi:hypothetical protein